MDPFAEAVVGRKSQVEEGPQVARAVPEVALADLEGVLPALEDPAGAVGALGQVLPPQAEDQKTWFSLFSASLELHFTFFSFIQNENKNTQNETTPWHLKKVEP